MCDVVCQIIQDQNISTMKADPSTALAADLQWLKYTCYNWVIFCYSVGRNGEGGALFVAIERVSQSVSGVHCVVYVHT